MLMLPTVIFTIGVMVWAYRRKQAGGMTARLAATVTGAVVLVNTFGMGISAGVSAEDSFAVGLLSMVLAAASILAVALVLKMLSAKSH